MGILVSDYDGTFLTSKKDIIINCEAIEKYISNGNYFLLSSGRPYNSLRKQIEKYNIPHTHLAVSDGSFLFDSYGNLLHSGKIKEEIVNIIDPLSNLDIFEGIQFSYPKYNSNSYDYNQNLGSIAFIVRKEKITDEFLKLFHDLEYKHPNYRYDIYGYNGTYYYEIRENGISKSTPIEYLRKQLEINKKKIYTIGDNDNDLEMIRDYNGYMIGNNKNLEKVALKKYNAVHELISDIERKKVLKRW